MGNNMSQTTKKYIVSSLITFVAGFFLAIYPLINDLTLEGLKDGAIFAVLFTGLRAGIKALIEFAFVK